MGKTLRTSNQKGSPPVIRHKPLEYDRRDTPFRFGGRHLRLLLDRDTVNLTASSFIEGLAAKTEVQVWSTSATETPHFKWDPASCVNDVIAVEEHTGSKYPTLRGVPAASALRSMARYAAKHNSALNEDAVFLSLVKERVAGVGEVDILVTEDSYLLAPARNGLESRSMSIADTTASIGLFLRQREVFRVEKDFSVGAGLFYSTAAGQLLAEWPRWRDYLDYRAAASGTPLSTDLVGLARSPHTRLGRALEARDQVHLQYQGPQNNRTIDKALFYLDAYLLQLGGALDSMARVLHYIENLEGQLRYASFRKLQWRDRLGTACPDMVPLLQPGTAFLDAVDLTALLRNNIHGSPLNSIAVTNQTTPYAPVNNVLWVPKDDEVALLAILDRQGGRGLWGARTLGGVGLVIELDIFVERSLRLVVSSLNSLYTAHVGTYVATPPLGYYGYSLDPRFQSIIALAGL